MKIARFMPRVQIVEKHNTSARRLVMRGHNGKLYSYLVMHDAGLGDTRREERVLQILRMLNHYLTKQKVDSFIIYYKNIINIDIKISNSFIGNFSEVFILYSTQSCCCISSTTFSRR